MSHRASGDPEPAVIAPPITIDLNPTPPKPAVIAILNRL